MVESGGGEEVTRTSPSCASPPQQVTRFRRDIKGNGSSRRSQGETCIRSVIYRSPEELEIVFRNLTYSVPPNWERQRRRSSWRAQDSPPVPILRGVTGRIRPRRLTAIMGNSGAGKSILLELLSGTARFKGANLEGTILVNGDEHPWNMLRKFSGLVCQHDLLLPSMTVREAIQMSAELRLPSTISPEERSRRVKDLIRLLHLSNVADVQAGSDFCKGLSSCERKKTAIAMELIINPAILYLDKPTARMDAAEAYQLMYILQKLAQQGRTVVVTVHQLGTDMFNLFDDVILLSKGRIAYAGPTSNLVSFFARHGHHCPQFMNPPDYILMNVLCDCEPNDDDVEENDCREAPPIEAVPAHCDRVERALQEWDESSEAKELHTRCQVRPRIGVAFTALRGSASWWRQCWFLLRRIGKETARSPGLVAFGFAFCIYMGLLVGLAFINTNDYDRRVRVRNKTGALFVLASNFFIDTSRAPTGSFWAGRLIFLREIDAGYYSPDAYYVSKTLADVPWALCLPSMTLIICYYLIGLTPSFSSYLLMTALGCLDVLCGVAYGMLLGILFDDLGMAINVAYIPIAMLVAVSGVFVARMPGWLGWLRYISPIFYAYAGMVQTEFAGGLHDCGTRGRTCLREEIYEELNFDPVFSPGLDLVFLAVIYIVLWIAGYIALRWRLCRRRRI